ncbi:putative thiol methyltransferase [Lachnellula occidentalis]|uniref:Putative thiol methyltransferase n=1 Tax=Lachnellula occidentalis TaxID=215460 RepID=A0A8H8S9K5_9HELO|nr:putative thiol methyltransferase [Lachnellula occidentalis]
MTDQSSQAKYSRGRLFSHFDNTDPSQHGPKWDELWREDFHPWDNGTPNPAFIEVLTEHRNLFEDPPEGRKRKALVPGCGRGYDVLLLAAHGYDAYGLEISAKALENAKRVEGEKSGEDIYKTKEGVERGKVTWLAGDFFKGDFQKDVEGETFDLIYDYTFLSALPPSMRPAWSKRMTELLAPKGRLVCLEWPTDKPSSEGGPPWSLPSKVYKCHLQHPGEELPYDKDSDLKEADIRGQSNSIGLISVAHFQPKRTFQSRGYDAEGNVTDWIGVWKR